MDPEISDMFAKAMEKAIAEGKGWKTEAERKKYLDKVNDDDYLPAIFCTNEEELANAPDAEAFAELLMDNETPSTMMQGCKDKGNESMKLGKQNVAKNVQYYRDAINHYMQAIGWWDKIVPIDEDPPEGHIKDEKEKLAESRNEEHKEYTRKELDLYKSTLLSNKAMAHMELKNWGFVIEDSLKSLMLNGSNVKSWYRLAKAHETRREYEECMTACDKGLKVDPDNKALKKVSDKVMKKAEAARTARQKKEREKARRVGEVKSLWKFCKDKGIKLGRVPLVNTLDDDGDEDDTEEKRWNHQLPHTGKMPKIRSLMEYEFPAMFLYPAVGQSDFVDGMESGEMIALRLAQMFPDEDGPTPMPWDYNDEYKCSNLAIYFEVHQPSGGGKAQHWEGVRRLDDMGEAMRFWVNARAMKGSDGQEEMEKAKKDERVKLRKYMKEWCEENSKHKVPEPCEVVRVHPAATLEQVLTDKRMVVPNFLVTFLVFPMEHEAHKVFMKERKIAGIVQPEGIGAA